MVSRLRIGELLVDAGLLTRAQLELALHEQGVQGAGGKRLGQLIVSMKLVNEVQLARVLSQQLAVPWVSLAHIDFSKTLLAMIPQEMAERFCVIPVYVRRERRDVDTLYLAMDDPTHDEALRVVGELVGMPVRPMIAPPSDILAAIARNYGPPREVESEPVAELFPLPLVKKPATVKDSSMFVALELPSAGATSVTTTTATALGSEPATAAIQSTATPVVSTSQSASAATRETTKRSEFQAKPPPVPSKAKLSDGRVLTPAVSVDPALLQAAQSTQEPPRIAAAHTEAKVPQLVSLESLMAVQLPSVPVGQAVQSPANAANVARETPPSIIGAREAAAHEVSGVLDGLAPVLSNAPRTNVGPEALVQDVISPEILQTNSAAVDTARAPVPSEVSAPTERETSATPSVADTAPTASTAVDTVAPKAAPSVAPSRATASPTPAGGLSAAAPTAASTDGKKPLGMLALTLLDGTRVTVASNGARTGNLHRKRDQLASDDPVRDARAIIDALKAQTQHLPTAERERRTESVLAALLTVLLRKGVLTEDEMLTTLHGDRSQ